MQHVSLREDVIRDMVVLLESQARGMWRYRWRAVVVAWVFSVIGWLAVYAMPPVYEASARVYVDTENAIRPLRQGIARTENMSL